MNNYIPPGYENNEIFKGLIVPEGDSLPHCSDSKACSGLYCTQNCIFGNEKTLKQYLKLKERKEKLQKLYEKY
jgi:hypothetical protein